MKRLITGILCGLMLTSAAIADDHQEYQFRVLLDGKKIGTHLYTVTDSEDGRVVQSDASFDVRFLFFTAYRYRHSNTELWNGDCLQNLSSQTDANGKQVAVSGEAMDDGFVVSLQDEARSLPACVSSFAYWDVDFLDQQRLLNPQTGDYVDVDITAIGETELTLDGELVSALQYRLTGEGIELDIWYSQDDEWLALQSVAKGGRLLRYERVGDTA